MDEQSKADDLPTTLEDALERLRLANKRTDDLRAHLYEERVPSLILLGEGSFGQIFYVLTQSVVFKACFTSDDEAATQLKHEFRLCAAMNAAASGHQGGGSRASSFVVPRPWTLWKPATSELVDLEWSPPLAPPSETRRPPRSSSPGDATPSVWDSFSTPTFVLDVVPALALPYADTFLSLFVAPELHSQCGVRLLRLYLGRDDFPAVTATLQPGLRSDFPLDIRRYDRFRQAMAPSRLPEAEAIATGMGAALLAKMHWCAGINGRDVELVLGGYGVGSVQCYAFDFNQCQRWLIPNALGVLLDDDLDRNITEGTYFDPDGDLVPGAKRLAMLISGQELYYPRPHQPLYAAFKTGYLATVASILEGRGPSQSWHTRISRASEAFCAEFERLNAEKQGRRGRIGRRV
ncbi:uncharacterized protein LOC62_02G002044 [Vanrija pseudolonga]|uniref:DUF3669 domain-containing protein n=1 Tax=Vanrija pseudolonga TaxID=143232 RepID=A0AAF0Y330_9TREE|nr:hypothetical protein LOC62_02G002044 [Vanrija pseudolonga]